MSREDNYIAARKIFAQYGSFFGLVVQEIGLERALSLHAQASEQQGRLVGQQLKAKLSEINSLATLGDVLRSSNLSIGIECSLSQSDENHAVFSNSQCPMYDGYRAGGLDDSTSEALCQVGASAKLGTMLKLLDPHIQYQLKVYRPSPEIPCTEEIYYSYQYTGQDAETDKKK